MIDIKNADAEVKELYKYLSDITEDIVSAQSKVLDGLVKSLSKGIDTCTNEELRTYMAKITIEAYNLSIQREHSSLKEACATALYKEGVANAFNTATGTVEARKNSSIIQSVDKQAVSILYSAVSELFKAKTDEAHRLASMLSNLLISRSAEAKLVYSPRSEVSAQDIPNQQQLKNNMIFV